MTIITKTGRDAHELIESQLTKHTDGVLAVLASFEPKNALSAWSDTIRAIEEFINLPGELNDLVIYEALITLPLHGGNIPPRHFRFVLHHLEYIYGAAFSNRQCNLLIQLSAMQGSFSLNGISEVTIGLETAGSAVQYLQSRRRHLVSLYYLIPGSCRGQIMMTHKNAITYMLPLAEISGTTITGLLQNRALCQLCNDFKLFLDKSGFRVSHRYRPLDEMFLEAERVPIIDLQESYNFPLSLDEVPQDKVFSAAEMRNSILILTAAYAEFDLGNTAFGKFSALARELLVNVKDDYWISVSRAHLSELIQKHGIPLIHAKDLIFTGTSYVDAINSYAPFVQDGEDLLSTVSLLQRFLYNYKNVCLYSKRRFQIRSGFIFESRVRKDLSAQGFSIQETKRIERKEFDVIAIRDGVVFNVQCKNNLVDPSWIDLNPARFIRTNRLLEKYYERAIVKERSREHLLKNKFNLDKIETFVITRFPIVSDNPRILALARIQEFSAIADKVINEQ